MQDGESRSLMVANTGNGENENEKERYAMVVNSNNSRKNDKRNTKKTKQPITPAEACELLASAISYCNEAGLVVTGSNHGLSLRLQINGMNYSNDKFVVTSQDVTTNPKVTIESLKDVTINSTEM